MYKIIGADNWDRETVAQTLVADNIQHEELGKKMVRGLNAGANDYTPTYYRLVPADYVLWRGMADLVGD